MLSFYSLFRFIKVKRSIMSSSLDEILSSDNSEYYESNEEMSEKSSSESEGESALFQNKDKTNRKHNSTKSKQPLNSTMRNESTLLKNLKKHRLQLQAMKKNQNKIQPKYANQTKTNEVEETPHIVNIPCKNLMKEPNLKSFHYNIRGALGGGPQSSFIRSCFVTTKYKSSSGIVS